MDTKSQQFQVIADEEKNIDPEPMVEVIWEQMKKKPQNKNKKYCVA